MPPSRLFFLTALLLPVAPPAHCDDIAPARAAYSCSIDGVLTFADRPCSSSAVRTVIDVPEGSTERGPQPGPGPAATAPSSPPAQTRAPRPERAPPGDGATREARCRQLAAELRSIEAELRDGYDDRRGRRLDARRLELATERRRRHCPTR